MATGVTRKYGLGLKLRGNVLEVDIAALSGITGLVPQSRQITAGNGLTGGGSLTADRSFALDYSAVAPAALGVASAGVSTKPPRADHVHPTTGLALLAGATFTGAVSCNSGFQAGVSGSTKIKVDEDALLIGHSTGVGAGTVAVILANNGKIAALDNANNPRSLLHLSAMNDFVIGDELGPIYISGGSSGPVALLVGGNSRVSANNNDITVTASTTGLMKFVFDSTEKFRLHNDGGLLIGSGVVDNVLGAVGIGIQNNSAVQHRNNADNAWIPSLKLDASDQLILGDTTNTRLDLICGSSGAGVVRVLRGATQIAELNNQGETTGDTALKLRLNITGTPVFYQVKVATTADAIPPGAYLLYVIP